MGDVTARIQSVEDARELARRRLPKGIFQYYDGGSGSDVTTRANLAAFEQVLFRPHVARWYPERDLRTTICGHDVSMPVGLSSCGQLAIGHRDGECGVARAAGAAKTLMFVSGATSTPIEEIMAAASGPIFYQLYYLGGREASEAIVERVKRAGVQGLVLTVDSAAPSRGPRQRPFWERARVPEGMGIREAIRFAPQALVRPRWLADFLRDGMPEPSVAMALNDEGQADAPLRRRHQGDVQGDAAVGGHPEAAGALAGAAGREGDPPRRRCAPGRRRGRRRDRRLEPRRQLPRRQHAVPPRAAGDRRRRR